MKESNTNREDVKQMLAGLANDVVNLMLREHLNISQELEHISKLVGDASQSLIDNFDDLNSIVVRQNALHNTGDNTTNNRHSLKKQIKKNQLNIITALQFDDIVQQLTKHSQNRTTHIQIMFKKLAKYLEETNKADYHLSPAFNARIIELKQDIANLRIELEKENPVKQSSLSTGKIELF